MNVKTVFLMLLLCVVGTFISSDAFAAIYKYTDKDGMIYFADDLQSVPAQYRSTAKIVSGEVKSEEKPPASQNLQAPLQEAEKKEQAPPSIPEKSFFERAETGFFGGRALISVLVVISALFAFYILKVLDAEHKKSVVIARMAIVWGVSLFLVYNHAGDVVAAFRGATQSMESVQQESAEKGKKAAKAMKALDTLIEHAEKMSSSDSGGAGQEKKEGR